MHKIFQIYFCIKGKHLKNMHTAQVSELSHLTAVMSHHFQPSCVGQKPR